MDAQRIMDMEHVDKLEQSKDQLNKMINLLNDPSLTEEEKVSALKYLEFVKYSIELCILERCLDQKSTDVNSVSAKILSAESSIQGLLDMVNDLLTQHPDNENYKRVRNEFTRKKEYLMNRQFDFYVDAMNKRIETREELEDLCYGTLFGGVDEFAHLFGVDKPTDVLVGQKINDLFLLSRDEKLKNELREYVTNLDYVINNQRFEDYMAIIEQNLELVTKFVYKRIKTNVSTLQKIEVCRSNLAKNKLELSNLLSSPKRVLRYSSKISQLKKFIQNDEKAIADFEQKVQEREELEQALASIGLGAIATTYDSEFDKKGETVEERVVAYLRFNLNSHGLLEGDKREYLFAPEEGLSEEQVFDLMRDSKDRLSVEGRRLVESYNEDLVKFFELEKTGELNKLLYAYILKSLSDMMNLTPEEMISLCTICPDLRMDEDKLATSYSRVYGNDIMNIQEGLSELVQEVGLFQEQDSEQEEIELPKMKM